MSIKEYLELKNEIAESGGTVLNEPAKSKQETVV